MGSLIELNNIFKIYKNGSTETYALNDVSLKVNTNEFISIVGASGSGKSTLMNIIGCLDFPTKGSYLLDGKEVTNKTLTELSKIRNTQIGFIFQQYFLMPKLTVKDNVELPLLYKGLKSKERHKISLEALEQLGILDKANMYPNQLSGGQQQRVAIARTIAGQTPIILADEPTGALDSKTGLEVLKIIKDLHDAGKTIIMITHDMTVASNAEKIIRIKDGKISSVENTEVENGI